MSKSIWNSLKGMGKRPHYEAVVWGKKKSIFASIIYNLVYFIRFLSPLQLWKQLYRYKDETKTDSKERTDFHAYHSEIYLIIVFLFFLANSYFDFFVEGSLLKTIVLTLFLIESIFWVLYYMLFRILIEKHLTIFNEAEYFLCLPIVIATQLLIISSLIATDGFDALSALSIMFNLNDVDVNINSNYEIMLGFIGFLYTTVIIANMINLIPAIPVQKRPNITIIGSGDVVENRMLPGLEAIYKPSQIAIVSPNINMEFKKDLLKKGILYKQIHTTKDIVNFIKSRSSFAIIATPTQYHYEYMTSLYQNNIHFAVEKPITHIKQHLVSLQENDVIMENNFLLSYYWLEKALPLNFFLTLNPIYQELLKIQADDKKLDDIDANHISELHFLKLKLGKIKSIDIDLVEGDESDERAKWTFDTKNGGMVFETLIHPITLLCNLFDNYELIKFNKIEWLKSNKKNSSNITGANIEGMHNNSIFKISLDKYQEESKKRGMNIDYENGNINLNLDNNTCIITSKDNKKITITINEEFSEKYEVQMILLDKFIQNQYKWSGHRFDDYPSQVDILNFLYDQLFIKYINDR